MPDDIVYSVFLTELEGQRRVVELTGSDLPQQGLETPVELRGEVTRYPAQGRTSIQLNGTEEQDITLEFSFNDRLTQLDGGALAMVQTLREILQAQGMVELQWGPDGFIRRGYLRRVAPRLFRRSLIGCSLVFLPLEADELFYTSAPMPVPAADDVSAILLLLDKIADATDEAIAIAGLAGAYV
jgi:hypothetical protein